MMFSNFYYWRMWFKRIKIKKKDDYSCIRKFTAFIIKGKFFFIIGPCVNGFPFKHMWLESFVQMLLICTWWWNIYVGRIKHMYFGFSFPLHFSCLNFIYNYVSILRCIPLEEEGMWKGIFTGIMQKYSRFSKKKISFIEAPTQHST